MTEEHPITCTRRLEFDAAHRIVNHESKCKYLHGHRYVVEATFVARKLDNLGRVIDFGAIKDRLGRWLDENWDHTAILSEKDAELGAAVVGFTKQKIYYLKVNPTAENMADYLLRKICPVLFKELSIECTRLRLYETPNCYAEAVAG